MKNLAGQTEDSNLRLTARQRVRYDGAHKKNAFLNENFSRSDQQQGNRIEGSECQTIVVELAVNYFFFRLLPRHRRGNVMT